MKTKLSKPKRSKIHKKILLSICLAAISSFTFAQDADSIKTLLGSNANIVFVRGINLKINSIQNDIGTLFEINGGALYNNKLFGGIAGGFNIGHPHVNYGYLGLLGQYTFKPNDLLHPSVQILIASGSTKDYERPKSSAFDNLLNITGASFYLFEPGINLELNVRKTTQFVVGISYRYVTGLDEDSKHVSLTNVTNKDMSGLNISVGVKNHKSKKVK